MNKYIQLLNALSMLPGIYLAFTHLYDHDCFFKRMSAYSYMITSLCSMNYHFYRYHIEDGRKIDKELSTNHKISLWFDLISQDICVFFTSFSTVAFGYGAYWIILSSLAFVLFGNINSPKIRLLRHINNATLIGIMSSDNKYAMWYFGLSMTSFLIARVYDKLAFLHSIFHIFLGYAMNSIWIYDYKHNYTNNIIMNPYFADLIAFASVVFCLHKFIDLYSNTKKTKDTLNYVIHLFINTFLSIYNAYCFFKIFRSDKLYEIYPERKDIFDLQIQQISYELGYYLGYMIYDIYIEKHDMLMHHILTFLCISISHKFKYHYLINLVLFIFSQSTPFLTSAKLFRHMEWKKSANISFIIFAATFFIFRICSLPIILKITIFDGWYHSTWFPYIVLNSLMISIYALQINWFKKIVYILLNNKN